MPDGPPIKARIATSAVIAPDAQIADDVIIGEHVSIGAGAVIGAGCRLHSNATLYPGVRMGARCEVHSGAVLGSDSYGYEETRDAVFKTPRHCGVVLGDEVEIGPQSVIEAGAERDTRLDDQVKIGALVMVGHDCVIGRRTRLIAQVGLASGVTLGEEVLLMGQVGVRAGATIASRIVVLARSGVYGDLTRSGVYLGTPARPRMQALRIMAAAARLPGWLAKRRGG
jgi:UDP-3-O-[3-hydroxymyristoyl] glucosamine N-acyltransferase